VVPRRAVDGPLIPVFHACRESFGRPYIWKVFVLPPQRFCGHSTMFYVRATSHAHPMVRDQVKETMHEWAKIRQELNGVTRGGRTGNQAWKTLEEVLQQTLDDVIKMDRMLITIQFSISEGTWRELFFGAQNGSTAVTGDFPTKGAPRNC
jgi:hypothetical protein